MVSDLHLGSRYFCHDNFLEWLAGLPDSAPLILNGDIIDDPRTPLDEAHRAVLERLVRESHCRPLVWVYGNHDEGVALEDPGRIHFARRWQLGHRLLIVHGDSLDELMPRHNLFKKVFKLIHRLRVRLGFPDMHVAQYAKKWQLFYRVLNDHVARKALKAARTQGFEAITCGHTHAAMDLRQGGVRYLNTGAWTEEPHHFLEVDAEGIRLRAYPNGKG